MHRRSFLQFGLMGSALLAMANRGLANPAKTLRQACTAKGFDVGIMVNINDATTDEFMVNASRHFSLAANLGTEIEWGSNEGIYWKPPFRYLDKFLKACEKHDMRARIRQIYSHENMPQNLAKNVDDGSMRTPKQLEALLVKRVDLVCAQFDPKTTMTLQVMDEILDNKKWLRQDPLTSVLGDKVIEIIFQRAREHLPNAKLTYQEEGIDVDAQHFFRHKAQNFIKLLERMKKQNIPCTGVAIGGWYNPATGQPNYSDWLFRNICDLGYDLHVSELTTVYGLRGANRRWNPPPGPQQERIVSKVYREVFDYLISLGNLKEITFWAPIDSSRNMMRTGFGRVIEPYKNAEPGILDKDFSEKKVYRQLVDLVEAK